MAAQAQPDGAFPRVNLAMIKSGKYDNLIVSLVCRHVEYDGVNTLRVECADGGAMPVQVDEGYEFAPGKVVEIMGHLQDGETPLQVSGPFVSYLVKTCAHYLLTRTNHRDLQHFLTRSVGEGLSLDVYNDMIEQVWTNHKYKDLFAQMPV